MSFEPTELLRKPGAINDLIDFCLMGMLIRHTAYDDLDGVSRQIKKVLDFLDNTCVTDRKIMVDKVIEAFNKRNGTR